MIPRKSFNPPILLPESSINLLRVLFFGMYFRALLFLNVKTYLK